MASPPRDPNFYPLAEQARLECARWCAYTLYEGRFSIEGPEDYSEAVREACVVWALGPGKDRVRHNKTARLILHRVTLSLLNDSGYSAWLLSLPRKLRYV